MAILQPMTAEAVLTPIPVLKEDQSVVAGRFLRESAYPRLTSAAQDAFRYRWGPWLWGMTAGPVGPNTRRAVDAAA